MLAWNAHVPEGGAASNGARFGVALPDVPDDIGHLPIMLEELGVASEGLNGPVPLSWTEIASWSRATAFPATPFEARALHMMSQAYVGIARQKDPDCPVGEHDEALDVIEEANVDSWMAFAAEIGDG